MVAAWMQRRIICYRYDGEMKNESVHTSHARSSSLHAALGRRLPVFPFIESPRQKILRYSLLRGLLSRVENFIAGPSLRHHGLVLVDGVLAFRGKF